VVMPIADGFETTIQSFVSTNGGVSYQGPITIDSISEHFVAGGIRIHEFPSADVDDGGTVYTVWHDCRFRSGCSSNDLVMSSTTNGTTWTPVTRIPIDPTNSGEDHFIPGLGVDPAATGHLGLVYYYYPIANCTDSTCAPTVGFVSSTDGGVTWSAARQLSGPFSNLGLPLTTSGYMFGDYNSVSFIGGMSHTVFAIEKGTSCTLGNVTSCKEVMASPRRGLAIVGGTLRAEAGPVLSGPSGSSVLQSSR
jgi:hypothetical protein